ncbi:hypothetical protein AKG98_3210 [Moritella sp. JT01]|nr:hypothetical protein AKG98_3210 [Moritella sp. JT01]
MTFNCSLETFVTSPLSFFTASKMFQASYNVILNYDSVLELILMDVQEFISNVGGQTAIIISLLAALWAICSNIITNKRIKTHKSKLQELTRIKKDSDYRKLELYKTVLKPLTDLTAKISEEGKLSLDDISQFDKERLEMSAQLALFASSDVFDKFTELVDYMYNSQELFSSIDEFEFEVFRVKMLKLLSEMRRDIGFHKDEITYKGYR